jgi:hypothetical protein
VVARGERIVAWSAEGAAFLVDARSGECRWTLRPPERVLALEDGGTLACLRRGSDASPDVALWDVVRGDRVGPLVDLPRRSFGVAIRRGGVTLSYYDDTNVLAQARRRRFDRRGTPVSDEAVTEVRTRAPAVWSGVVLGDVVRASPLAEIVLAPDDTTHEVALGAPLDDRGERYSYRLRASVGGPGSAHLVVHAAGLRRARVVDVFRRVLVPGPWDTLDVRAVFFVGSHVVTATDAALDARDLGGRRRFSRPLGARTLVARVDERHVAVATADGIAVVDVARDAVVARVGIEACDALFGGEGRLVAAHPDGTITILARR